MKVEIVNTNFKNIKTAVCYSRGKDENGNISFKFIPTASTKIIPTLNDINNCHKSNYAMYLGNNELLSNNDFNQYNFSYYIDKYKFKDGLMINLLDDESRNIISDDKDSVVLTEIEDKLCPSAIDDNSVPEFDYFGSSIFGKQRFFSIDLKKEVYKIELYEDVILTNHNLENNETKFYEYGIFDYIKDNSLSYSETPAIIVTLGPDKSLTANNSEDWYYNGDTKEETTVSLGPVSYRKLEEEILFNKTLNIYLPNAFELVGKTPPVNITLESWNADNKNPNRNSHKHILRNNEFYSLLNNIKPIKPSNYNLRYDVNSMTLVSNSELIPKDNCPILKNKEKSITNNLWNPRVRYKLGDIVTFDNLSLMSLVDNNINNNPLLSSCWEECDNLTNYFTSRLNVYFNKSEYSGIGIIKPGNSVILTESTDYLEVNVVPSIGFSIDINSISIYPEYNGSDEISRNNGEYYYYTTQDLGHLFVFKDSQLDLLREIDYLYIKCEPKTYLVNFMVFVDSKDKYSWSDWVKDNDSVALNIKDKEALNTSKDSIEVKTRDYLENIQLVGSNYSMVGIKTDSGKIILAENNIVKSIQVLPTQIEDAVSIINYTILVESPEFYLVVEEFSGFIVENTYQKIKSGSKGSIRFYENDPSFKKFSKVIITTTKEESKSIELTVDNSNSSEFGGVVLSLNEDNGIYTLDFEKITTNLNIRLL